MIASYNGSLEAVNCHIHSLRYDVVGEQGAGGRLRCLIRSPTSCSDADTSNQCLSCDEDASILSRPAIMGH
eukprot:scaffold2481_cov86-Skeletonema_marinoi.AAC.3